jgi:hypothetical protein
MLKDVQEGAIEICKNEKEALAWTPMIDTRTSTKIIPTPTEKLDVAMKESDSSPMHKRDKKALTKK